MSTPEEIVNAVIAKADKSAAGHGFTGAAAEAFVIGYLRGELEAALASAPRHAARRAKDLGFSRPPLPLDLKPHPGG